MSTWLPPLFTGRIPTTSRRLLLALGLMALPNLLLMPLLLIWPFIWWFCQSMLLAAVLLLSPRFWVALLLMLSISLATMALVHEPNSQTSALVCGVLLLPLWVGFFVSYRPWKD